MKLNTEEYISKYFEMFAANQKAMAASIQSLKCCEDIINVGQLKSILDCGSGVSTVFFHTKFDNVTTIDNSQEWGTVTKNFLLNTLNKDIVITTIEHLEENTFDFIFYDYGDIETRIYYFKQALEKCKKILYLDDMHISFYREYVESRAKKYKLRYLPNSVDEYGRYGAIIIKS